MRNLQHVRRHTRHKVYEYAAAGHSFDEIAERLGADRSILARWILEDQSIKDAFNAGRQAMQKGASSA